jgi:hypothetical protein
VRLDDSTTLKAWNDRAPREAVTFCVNPKRLFLGMLALGTVLVAISGVGRVILGFLIPHGPHYRLFVLMFDVNWEGTVPALRTAGRAYGQRDGAFVSRGRTRSETIVRTSARGQKRTPIGNGSSYAARTALLWL